MDLRAQIHEAFPKEGAPGYRLSDAIIEDDFGDKTYCFEENWQTWVEIENWQLVKSDVFFCYAPKTAAIYIMPRFMLFVLDEIEGALSSEYQGFGAGDAVVWFIQSLKRKGFKSSGLSELQICVTEKFLATICQDYDYAIMIDVGKTQY